MRIAVALLLICLIASARAGSMFRCEIAGVTTYSDRPCAADAQPHELNDSSVNTYAAPPLPSNVRPKQQSARPQKKRVAADESKATEGVELCARLSRSSKEVRSKMRAGYKTKEGERLRERLAKLKAQADEAKCR